MFGRVDTAAIVGVEGEPVKVEADLSDGLPSFDLVGFLSSEVKEARERVRAALKNSGVFLEPGKLVISLSPADLRKQGNSFDLPIAVSVLIAGGFVPQSVCDRFFFTGELALDGTLNPINGTLSHVLKAADLGKEGIIVPLQNAPEGAVLEALPVYGFRSLKEVISFLLAPGSCKPEPAPSVPERCAYEMDFSEILGQESVKRAAEVACAGMHALLLVGPPGSGKTLTAKRIPTILPPLTREEQIETSRIHSVCGLLGRDSGLLTERPFRSPHHTISMSALVGGGTVPHPGEMSLAHNGVLFLDELPEFSKAVLEVMRQPLEDRKVTISRVHGSYVFPTRTMLVCAMNPCKCGFYPDRNRCHCRESEVRQYLSRVSKPLLDRIDISVEAPKVSVSDLQRSAPGESSKDIRARVIRAWEIQKERYRDLNIVFNSQLEGGLVRTYCRLGKEESDYLREIFDGLNLSARAHDRILKVSRTIADLAGAEDITAAHLSEAVSYRLIDRKFWRE